MPLTATIAAGVCVSAALVMLALARDSASRAAHAVTLVVMVVLTVDMRSATLAFASAAVLALTAGTLLSQRRAGEARRCAVDVIVCAGLVALMGVASVVRPDHTSMPGEMAGMHTADDPLGSMVLAVLAGCLVAGWALATHGGRRPTRPAGPGTVAAWSMMVGMALMAAS